MTEIDGEVRQDASTSDLIFDVPTLVSYLSHITTLIPGDMIFTGTPEGVGMVDGRLLTDGAVIRTTIDGVGTMVNRCRRITDWREPVIPPRVRCLGQASDPGSDAWVSGSRPRCRRCRARLLRRCGCG